MRKSKSGWKRKDLDALYEGYGFEIQHRSNHDVAKHPDYPEIRVTLPRHRKVKKYLITHAVKTIDKLIQLQTEKEAEDDIIEESVEEDTDE
jgi:hypothetical protein